MAAHPCNQPVVDAALRRVVSGAGIVQPRLATPLPAAGQATTPAQADPQADPQQGPPAEPSNVIRSAALAYLRQQRNTA